MKRVYVAGHRGMVGSALCRVLSEFPEIELVTKTHSELDLCNQSEVNKFFRVESIDEVYLAAAKVGGIHANNTYPADFIYQNLMIQNNVIHAAHQYGVQNMLFLGSSCIYPKNVAQPMAEDALLTGVLEPTNEPYAIAKIAGIKLCESYNRQYGRNYRSVMPTNLYGPNDNFHPENSHVIPALIRRFHEAKVNARESVTVWGSGSPKREFLFVDEMAQASVHMMSIPSEQLEQHTSDRLSHINIGTGEDCSIKQLAETIAEVIGFEGSIIWDSTKPDGTPRKLMDVRRAHSLGWCSKVPFKKGLEVTYKWFLENATEIRGY